MTIKELRMQTHLSQSAFAKKYYLNIRTLQSWEQGIRQTPQYVIELIQELLKTDKSSSPELDTIESARTTQKVKKDLRVSRCLEEYMTFELFKSEVCHLLKSKGDIDFVETILTFNFVGILWNKKWYSKAFYILALLDYISDKYTVPYFDEYNSYRQLKLDYIIFPTDVIYLDKLGHHDAKQTAIDECKDDAIGKYFFKYGIIERDIYNVV